jgi:Ca2+-binding EF-hand superfamily protein
MYSEGAATPLSCFPVQRSSGTFGRMLSRIHIVACAGLLCPAMASAQVTATGDYLARMDTDGDGRIALAEYQAWMGYAFEHMDANRDGQLTADELPGGKGRAISLAEHRESLAAMFRRQDANKDGFLDANELSAPPR